jgi:pyruvate/oxaloacetate carboxyltransferase
MRFLDEDPGAFENPEKALPNTKLQMLLRGQNYLRYRNYSAI